MYNLIVSNQVAEGDYRAISVPAGRYLEYTAPSIAKQLSTLSQEAVGAIKSWPCVLMQEGRGEERAYLVEIESVRPSQGDLRVSASKSLLHSAFANNHLWRLRTQLDIEQFEFSRHHWAIKNRDLLGTLAEEGFEIDRQLENRFAMRPLPAPSRSRLLEARKVIAEWGHTDIDDLLLEAGVQDLDAGRDVGSRRDRANAILKFSLENPAAVTAEKRLFSTFIVRRAFPAQEQPTPSIEDTAPERITDTSRAVEQYEESRAPNRVFVVHGQNEEVRTQVVDFLSSLGLEPIVLHEQPNMGRHLLTKFIDEADLVTFAVVLMTDDDVGGSGDDDLAPRARQNVILELGYFLAHLGQARVCALVTPGLETPSDFDGIVYIRMTSDGSWQDELDRELRAAEMPVES